MANGRIHKTVETTMDRVAIQSYRLKIGGITGLNDESVSTTGSAASPNAYVMSTDRSITAVTGSPGVITVTYPTASYYSQILGYSVGMSGSGAGLTHAFNWKVVAEKLDPTTGTDVLHIRFENQGAGTWSAISPSGTFEISVVKILRNSDRNG